jgi:hypothetical protein
MKHLLIFLIIVYQKTTGFLESLGLIKKHCGFYPSCSEYGLESIKKHGSIKGLYYASKRILRCHPWQKERLDPVK